MILLHSTSLCLCLIVFFRSIDDTVSFAINNGVCRGERKIHSMRAWNPKLEDTIVMAGDAASLGFFSIVQSIVDPFESLLATLLGGDAVADYSLDVLANPLVASVVVIPCWLVAGFFSDAYIVGSSLRTAEESLKNALWTYLLYIPCVTIVLALFSALDDGAVIASPDFTFCAGAISIVGSWRFTLATTLGK